MPSNITPFPHAGLHQHSQVGFDRRELEQILGLYGRMVASGQWKDYAIDLGRHRAVFAAFRRASERPQYRIEKCPADRGRQGMWSLRGEHGQLLRRGHELSGILAPIERKLLKLVSD